MMIDNAKMKAVVLGHAVADALGVPVEFQKRAELDKNPVTDMREYGTYSCPAGVWSDDTSMSLCALDSLASGKLDYDEIMQNFGKWRYDNACTATGEVFDIGYTCAAAIECYIEFHKPAKECGMANERANGNGSLMRIYPFVLYLAAKDGELTDDGIDTVFTASALTHAHIRSKLGCGIYAFILMKLLEKPSIESIYGALAQAKDRLRCYPELSHYNRMFDEHFSELPRSEIRSSGYVVDTLEAAVWCLLTTSSYRKCVLKAVNLGDDTDTVGSVAGALAGVLYGFDAIPNEWLDKLKRREYIEEMCERAYENLNKLQGGQQTMNEIERQNAELETVIQLLTAFKDAEDDETEEDEEKEDNVIQVLRLIEWLKGKEHSAKDILECVKYVLRDGGNQ